MKKTEADSWNMLVLTRVLLGIVLFLVILIIAGTIYGLVFKGPGGGQALSGNPAAQSGGGDDPAGTSAGERVFTGIGRVRAQTAPPGSATLIVSIAFPYYPEDRAFSEELASKISEFRGETLEYFSSHSADEIRMKDEGTIKAELLRRYNSLLRLGNITVLYFNDYMIL